jgi:hypothetical protein
MTRCCMTGKHVKCSECGSNKISFFYKTAETILYCQNRDCSTIGRTVFVTYHHSHEKYPEIITTRKWDYNGRDNAIKTRQKQARLF